MARPFKGVTFWDRVWLKVRISELDCIEYTGPLDDCGYGRINRNGKLVRIHREVWEFNHGPIPKGLCVRHSCDNPACININHLLIGTHAENMRDKSERGRVVSSPGSSNGSAKLDESGVAEIKRRLDSGETCAAIARDYPVSESNIRHIKKGRKWAHVSYGS
jgi:hypothetical protein